MTAVLVCLFSASVGVPVARSTRYSHLRPSDEPAARSAFSLPANRLWITLYHLPPYAFISSFFSLCFADIARYMPCTWMLVSRCRFRHRWCDSLSLSRMCRVKDTRQGLAERPWNRVCMCACAKSKRLWNARHCWIRKQTGLLEEPAAETSSFWNTGFERRIFGNCLVLETFSILTISF